MPLITYDDVKKDEYSMTTVTPSPAPGDESKDCCCCCDTLSDLIQAEIAVHKNQAILGADRARELLAKIKAKMEALK